MDAEILELTLVMVSDECNTGSSSMSIIGMIRFGYRKSGARRHRSPVATDR